MLDERTSGLASAEKLARERSASERKKKSEKLAKRRPWKALKEHWDEEMRHAFGMGFKPTPWATRGKEVALARKLLAEVEELEVAKKMVTACIEEWVSQGRPGVPGFAFFFATRESTLAQAMGQAVSHKEMLNISEYSEELEKDSPDVGWGF